MTKRKKTQETPKGPYKIVAVPFGRNIEAYATTLEQTLNQFVAEGYSMNPTAHPKGTVIIGHKNDAPEAAEGASGQHPLVDMLRSMGAVPIGMIRGEPAGPDPMSDDTYELFSQFMKLQPDPKKLPDSVNTLLSNVPVDNLSRMADELTKGKEVHKKRCDAVTCTMPELLDALVEKMREHVKTRLQ